MAWKYESDKSNLTMEKIVSKLFGIDHVEIHVKLRYNIFLFATFIFRNFYYFRVDHL